MPDSAPESAAVSKSPAASRRPGFLRRLTGWLFGSITDVDAGDVTDVSGRQHGRAVTALPHAGTPDCFAAPHLLPAEQPAVAGHSERKKRQAARVGSEEKRLQQRQRQRDRLTRDITYLGRGVSGRLGERESRVELLREQSLPVMCTPLDVARQLGISLTRLRGLAYHSEVSGRLNYVQFRVCRRNGGERLLSAPHVRLKAVQRWIHEQILQRLSVTESAHGFVPGRSILSNAEIHAGQEFVLCMDIRDFFPSITFPRVRHQFVRCGYSQAVATILALLCTECPRELVELHGRRAWLSTGPRGLPQGACTSPALSNLVTARLDHRLRGLANRFGLNFSRYADDLTFSGGPVIRDRAGWLLERIRHLIEAEGFQVQEAKTRIQSRASAQVVTGLVVNDRPAVSRSHVRRMRAILHQAQSTGLESQNREQHPNFRAWVEGQIAWIAMTRPQAAARLRVQLQQVQ